MGNGDKTTHSRVWVNGTAVDVQVIFSQHLRSFVNSPSGSIKYAAKHVLRDTQLQTLPRKLDSGLYGVSYKPRIYRVVQQTFLTSIPDVPSKT